MRQAREAQKAGRIDGVIAQIKEKWPKKTADELTRFVTEYYRRAAPDDLGERPIEDLYGAAISHWHLARTRKPGQPKIHVFNPDPEQHGWESTHTIVQIVTDDMPFLVDSVSMALNRSDLTIHVIIHPIIALRRDDRGQVAAVPGEPEEHAGSCEACMHFEVDRQTEADFLEHLHREIAGVLHDVRKTVSDWQAMRERMTAVIDELTASATQLEGDELEEIQAFLEWAREDHFTFLGYRCYDLKKGKRLPALYSMGGTGLGILREDAASGHESRAFHALPDDVKQEARTGSVLTLTKTNRRATVHRPSYMDYIGVRRLNAKGEVIGEHRFLGLYTSAAYNRNPRSIPILRRKIDQVLKRAHLPPTSHAHKALVNVLETYPRDELFQISAEELHDIAIGVLHLQERQRVRLFVRRDPFRRFVSCLVFTPRDRYNTDVRQRMQHILEDTFHGDQSEFSIRLSESVLARIHFIVRIPDHEIPEFDPDALQRRIAETVRSWKDDLADALLDYYGEERGNRLYQRYGESFNAAYREDTSPRAAAHDIERLEHLNSDQTLAIVLYQPLEATEGLLRLRLFHYGHPVSLSDALPVLEHMGVRVIDERPYEIHSHQDRPDCFIHDFGLHYDERQDFEFERVHKIFEEAFAAARHGRVEDDGFNALVLGARLGWREIVILRAYSRYLRQAGTTYSLNYMQETFADNPRIARLLVRLFHTRFDPRRVDDKRASRLGEQIELALNDVPSLDQDRILRRTLSAIQATVRTNYYQNAGTRHFKDYVSFKLEPSLIPEMPQPRPRFEIYVYSPRTEGVHLRGGLVARGGIRWSDRREDFRTEVLGLMKAQMVKNAVIVPVGAKGGFVVKNPPLERDALQEEVRACYRIFIRGLLDITDNMVEGSVAPPARVVRHDADDPYLVVAADKGTATFSDLANEISREYGFWLRDAFASGGSSGYDHKKMGITARGGWEAVKRHFRELGVDIQNENFTVVGVGDMSGDVFGNAMLLSRRTRLIAAFDHRHIFIDPSPDAETSFGERQRLFNLPRSSWDDYDRSLISEGGGVYPRSAKSVTLSAEAREALATDAETLTPNELVQAIFRAPVDLLWNGGIGTFVKATSETHMQVGDKTNDTTRIDATELRCRVIGEGGNLGATQLSRIEFALGGGRINTDAIDNAGGVDCSDHEVNIKILLNEVVRQGDLTIKHRDRLLMEMTDEVAALVLRNNYRQTQALSTIEARAAELLSEHALFMHQLERDKRLNRRLEALPNDETLAERETAGLGLTRPEIAVLLAYDKISTFEALQAGDLLDEPYMERDLVDYFPTPLGERFRDRMGDHRLRREIIATVVTNELVNRMGAGFIHHMGETTGGHPTDIARAFYAVRDIYQLDELWAGIDQLDNRVSAVIQTQMLLEVQHLADRAILWLLRNAPRPLPIGETVERLRPTVQKLFQRLDEVLPGEERDKLAEEVDRLRGTGIPEEPARRIAAMDVLFAALDISKAGHETGVDLETATGVYFHTSSLLDLGWLSRAISTVATEDSWQERWRAGLEDDFFLQLRQLTTGVLSGARGEQAADTIVQNWAERHRNAADRLLRMVGELQGAGRTNIAMLSVAVQELKNLAQASAETA